MKIPRGKIGFNRWQLILLIVLIVITLISGGIFYYKSEERILRTDKYTELKAIADLITEQIVQWR